MCEFELPDVSLRCFVERQLLFQIYALSNVKFPHHKQWLCKKMKNMRYDNMTIYMIADDIIVENIREDFKYYFADFVCKGGTPHPLRTKFSPKKRLRIWGVPPFPPLRTKFSAKKSYGFGGYPPPLYGQNPQSGIWSFPLRMPMKSQQKWTENHSNWIVVNWRRGP